MEFRLKSISPSGIEKAIAKAEIYRYLNEPGEAESICSDILAIDPDNQAALSRLGLAITDQFKGDSSDRYEEAAQVFQRLTSPYENLYYRGLLLERRAKAQLRAGRPPHALLALFEEAMYNFEEAEKVRPEDNDDAILRWNRCARLLQSRNFELTREVSVIDVGDSPPI